MKVTVSVLAVSQGFRTASAHAAGALPALPVPQGAVPGRSGAHLHRASPRPIPDSGVFGIAPQRSVVGHLHTAIKLPALAIPQGGALDKGSVGLNRTLAMATFDEEPRQFCLESRSERHRNR